MSVGGCWSYKIVRTGAQQPFRHRSDPCSIFSAHLQLPAFYSGQWQDERTMSIAVYIIVYLYSSARLFLSFFLSSFLAFLPPLYPLLVFRYISRTSLYSRCSQILLLYLWNRITNIKTWKSSTNYSIFYQSNNPQLCMYTLSTGFTWRFKDLI